MDQPEFQSIHAILNGELKAIDMVINEFVQLFEINEGELAEAPDHSRSQGISSDSHSKASEEIEKRKDANEAN
ncbi:hypothetical protein HII26_09300 [Paenibacillus aquistagni]|nr:hypothetical protein [Paenibacillus aquistagni]